MVGRGDFSPRGRVRELVAQPPFFDAAALAFSFQVEKPQDRATAVAQTDPALHVLNDRSLFVRNAVQFVNQFVDFGVGAGDFAFHVVELRRRGRLEAGSSCAGTNPMNRLGPGPGFHSLFKLSD